LCLVIGTNTWDKKKEREKKIGYLLHYLWGWNAENNECGEWI
jgi:hypothetical protein